MPIELSRDPNGKPLTNVPHRVTRRSDEDTSQIAFEWGYSGAGPYELSMNILFNHGLPEPEASRLCTKFTDDILSGIPHEGAQISDQVIGDWIAMQ